MDRDEAINRIRAGLRTRTGKEWSVTGGRGTAWGWLKVSAPPRRCVDEQGRTGTGGGYLGLADAQELAAALGLDRVPMQGVSIAASSDYRREYVDRAEGRAPTTLGSPYWD